MTTVLAVGLDPACVDLTSMPGLTADLIKNYIESELERVRGLGYAVDGCLVCTDGTAVEALLDRLRNKVYDCVMVGAGLRAPDQLLLFENLVNVIHEHAPQAKICFNTKPKDSAEAVQRWVSAR